MNDDELMDALGVPDPRTAEERQLRIDAVRALNRLVPVLPSTARVHEDYNIIRAALAVEPVPVPDRTAWLIERATDGTEWWSGPPNGYVRDARLAVQFPNREAAEQVRVGLRLGGYTFVTEHIFISALAADPVPAPLDVERLARAIHDLRWCKAGDLWHALAHDDEDGYRGELVRAYAIATPPEPKP